LRGSDFVSLRFRVDGYWISLLSSWGCNNYTTPNKWDYHPQQGGT
jgi:hypothetical protein